VVTRAEAGRYVALVVVCCAMALSAAAQPGDADPDPVVASEAEEAPAGEDVRQRVERLYRNPRYQASYPGEGEPEPEPSRPPSGGPLLALLAELMSYAALIAGVLLLAYLVYDLVRSPGRRRRTAEESPVTPAPPPRREARPGPLPDPEALAAEGRFGEAVHALLLHAVPLLDSRRRSPWPPGATGREMAAAVDLEGAPRRALALLVAAVEHFLFARRPLTQEDWLVCRGAFHNLRAGIAGGGDAAAGSLDAGHHSAPGPGSGPEAGAEA